MDKIKAKESEIERYRQAGRVMVSGGEPECHYCQTIVPVGCTMVIDDGGNLICADCLPY